MLLLEAALIVGVASVLGGAAGFATSLLTTPLLLLIGFDLPTVVVVNLVATLVSRLVVIGREWKHVDARRVLFLGLGSAPGAWAGALTVGLLDGAVLRVAAGIVVAVLGLVLLFTPAVGAVRAPSRPAQVITGMVGGYLSTSTSLNGPPAAILLSRARPPARTFVADLAGYFVVTNSVSLAILAGGHIPTGILGPTVPVLVVAAVIGNQIGRRITNLLSAEVFRLVVIALVIVSGAVTALS